MNAAHLETVEMVIAGALARQLPFVFQPDRM
jgi:hypothetical protein